MKILRYPFVLPVLVALGLVGAAAVPALAAPGKAGPQEALVELLPARARAAFILRRNSIAPIREVLFADVEMMRELGPYLERSLGLDLTRLEGVAAFSMDVGKSDPKLGIILRVPTAGGALKLKAAGDAGGTPLYRLDGDIVCARLKTGIVLGNEAEVRAVVAVERGREAALPRDAGLGRLLVNDMNDTDLVIAFGPGAVMQAASFGVEDALLSYRHSGLIELVLHGEPERLSGLRAMAIGAIQAGVANLAQEKDKATATNEPLKGAAAIMLYHQARHLAAELDPKLVGNALTVRYQMPDTSAFSQPAGFAALAGIGAAIAIPSFIKYQQRSKSSEARVNVRGMSTSVMTWLLEPGHKLASLRSTDWVPAASCCGQANHRCVVDDKTFSGPTWKALGIQLSDPTRYQYRVLVEPKGKPARVLIEARGDLDCDTEYSSFRQSITLGSDGPTMGELDVQNELE